MLSLVDEGSREIHQYSNNNLHEIHTPVRPEILRNYLIDAQYDRDEIQFLVNGFTSGFSIGYRGPAKRQNSSRNIPFTPGVGDKIEMWNKIMKEVSEQRVAGSFSEIPFTNFIQSPIGLVPKADNKTRLIFHLSYKFSEAPEGQSLNACTPGDLCSTKYNDLDHAITSCLRTSGECKVPVYLAKSDLVSAFRMLPIKKQHWKWLIFKAENPITHEMVYFVDKCLPFGTSISCSHYQRFSNALKRITEFVTGKRWAITNYLDDFLFIEKSKERCDRLVRTFLSICKHIRVPVSLEKTEWATSNLTFLGILLDGEHLTLSIPLDKKEKALRILEYFGNKNKATVKQLQELTGFLNFLSQAIFPGRAFTRRMYAKYSGTINDKSGKFKKYHHVRLDQEFKFDCEVWKLFLQGDVYTFACRPMLDINNLQSATQLEFYSDASRNPDLGFGAVFRNEWIFGQWEAGFIEQQQPSISFLELYVLTAGILTWSDKLKNMCINICAL